MDINVSITVGPHNRAQIKDLLSMIEARAREARMLMLHAEEAAQKAQHAGPTLLIPNGTVPNLRNGHNGHGGGGSPAGGRMRIAPAGPDQAQLQKEAANLNGMGMNMLVHLVGNCHALIGVTSQEPPKAEEAKAAEPAPAVALP